MFATITVAVAATLGACAPSCVPTPGPAPTEACTEVPGARFNHCDPADDCPPGEVVVPDGATLGCDLVGGANTLTIEWPGADAYDEAYYRQLAEDAGCTFVVRPDHTGALVAAGERCDF